MKFKALLMTLLFVTGVAASVAVAKGPPPGKGKDKGSTSSSSTSTSTTDSGKGKGKNKKGTATTCKATVSFVLKGEFVSGTGAAAAPTAANPTPASPQITGTFQMDVKQANNHGRKYVGETATISVDSKTKFKRRGHAELEDFEAGDWLNVHVRACHPKKEKTGGAGTTTTSTTTTTLSAGETQAVLLAKQVIGKPGTSSGDTTGTTTTSP